MSDIWGTGPSDIWVVGQDGSTVLHRGSSGWQERTTDPGVINLWAIWGSDSNLVWVAGTNDELLRYDGAAWTAVATPSVPTFAHMWGADSNALWVVGDFGVMLRYSGVVDTVQRVTAHHLWGVWGTFSQDVWAVGDSGTILRGVRGATISLTPTQDTLTALGQTVQLAAQLLDGAANPVTDVSFTWSSSEPGLATVDSTGLVTAVANGTVTVTASVPGGASASATVVVEQVVTYAAIEPAGASLSGVGSTFTFTADFWDANDNPVSALTFTWSTLNPAVATVDAGGTVTAVASGQATIQVRGGGATAWALVTVSAPGATPVNLWARSASPTGNTLWRAWVASPSDAWTVGGGGNALHFDGTSWSGFLTNTTNFLNHVWGSSSSDVYAVGSGGKVTHYDGLAWDTLPSFTTSSLNVVWGAAPNDIFAAAGSEIFHYDGTSWTVQDTLTSTVYGIWGTSRSDVWAVGASGQIHRYDGSTWTPVFSPTAATIDNVWGTSPNDVYIGCGSAGAFRWDGTSWTDLAFPDLGVSFGFFSFDFVSEIWGSGPDDLYAVAVRASAVPDGWILHYDGVSWTTAIADSVGLYGLRGSSDGPVHAVGASGRIYRGVRGASVSLSPSLDTLTSLWDTTQLVLQVLDGGGNPVSGVSFTWTSSDESVATVDQDGNVTAAGNGTATITATPDFGPSANATIVVAQQPAGLSFMTQPSSTEAGWYIGPPMVVA
ncbi:MAG: Ig-like domain-containing protein, partial [Gemmatimonadales bacterium]